MLSDLRESGCLSNVKNESRLNSVNKKPINKMVTTQSFQKSSIKSWNKNTLINEKFIQFDFKGIKPTFLITLSNDTEICLTSNHRILSKNGWIRAFQIQEETELYCLNQTQNDQKLNYQYYKVKGIFYQGIKKVYDKTIPGFHNYLAQNIILHNSIEQDADIVIMLYREEYYTDNVSEEQITEVIVAKHRNGPIGTAKLLFKPSVTSFLNL
jgi:replicative DNA helicase